MAEIQQVFPQPLLRDLVEGRWLPVIGAGFSTRTPVLVGYSLDDPDFRQLWQVITDRLGTASVLFRNLTYLEIHEEEVDLVPAVPLGKLLRKRGVENLLGPQDMGRVREWMAIRNRAVHTMMPVDEHTARVIVDGVLEIVNALGRDS